MLSELLSVSDLLQYKVLSLMAIDIGGTSNAELMFIKRGVLPEPLPVFDWLQCTILSVIHIDIGVNWNVESMFNDLHKCFKK